MIEDKTIGLKIAENPEEAYWTNLKNLREKEILDCERAIEIDKHSLVLINQKLKLPSKA